MIYIIFAIFVIFMIVVFRRAFEMENQALEQKKQALEQLNRYTLIEIGMSEQEMLRLMGDGYNKSLLKNNRSKYEWRIGATSTGYYGGGVSFRKYSGVKKVDIYVKNGFVEEVKPYNV